MLQTFKNAELYALGMPQGNDPPPLAQLLDLKVIQARVQIRLVRLVKLLGEEANNLMETRNKYVRLYGEDKGNGNFSVTGPNDAGNPVSPNWEKYKKEMEDLMVQTTKLEFEKVVLPADVEISGRLLMTFEAFLDVADEEMVSENGHANDPVPMKGRAK